MRLTGPASRFSATSRFLQPARQVNSFVRAHCSDVQSRERSPCQAAVESGSKGPYSSRLRGRAEPGLRVIGRQMVRLRSVVFLGAERLADDQGEGGGQEYHADRTPRLRQELAGVFHPDHGNGEHAAQNETDDAQREADGVQEMQV